MGRYLREPRGIEKVSAMDVAEFGAKTMKRAREVVDAAEPVESVAVKMRKVAEGESEPPRSPSPTPALLQLENDDGDSVVPENSASPVSSSGSDHAKAAPSCSSSNDSSELTKENLKFIDLEEEGAEIATSRCNSDCAESGQMKLEREQLEAESGELVPPSELNSHLRNLEKKMTLDAEIDEFFAAAEENLLKKFADKYNFDFLKEQPLEGRYEWVQLA